MMKLNRLLAIFFGAAILTTLLAGCGKSEEDLVPSAAPKGTVSGKQTQETALTE
jgi:hypothetical protein